MPLDGHRSCIITSRWSCVCAAQPGLSQVSCASIHSPNHKPLSLLPLLATLLCLKLLEALERV